MTSINHSTAKVLLISATITAGIALSAFSTVKASQVSEHSIKKTPTNHGSQAQVYYEQSRYEKWLHKELSMIMPGKKQFNHEFLKQVLTKNLDK